MTTGTKPFIKWVGGKTSLLPEIVARLPEFDSYYEPFIGGGATYCHLNLRGKFVGLNDLNWELINTWKTVRDNVDELIESLKKHRNTKDYFLNIRNLDRDLIDFNLLSLVERASRFIFLNKTCFNGLYRVNKKDQFNTHYGKYENPKWCDEDLLRKISQKLNDEHVWLLNGDYKDFLPFDNRINAFVYLDPPYDIVSSTSNFTSYTSDKFDQNKQIELSQQVARLNGYGVKFLLSNADTPLINDLYKDFIIDKVECKRSINCKGDKRGKVGEVLIRNYEV
jgi:DNA adenine methylase